METIKFNGKKYPVKEVYIEDFGNRPVSVLSLADELITEDGDFVSEEAKAIDETIFFYVEDGEIIKEDLEEFISNMVF